MSKIDYFENYSQTQSLQNGFNQAQLDWGVNYFNNHFLPHLPENKDIKILEIGCGWGKFLKALELSGYNNLTGIDVSGQQVEIAKKYIGLKNIFVADAINYVDKSDDKFDVVILSDVLEHLQNDYAVELFIKIYDKLNKNGRIIVQVPNGMSLLNPIRYADITHVQAFIPQSLGQIFRLSGFNHIQCFAVPPKGAGLKTKVRGILWKLIINPIMNIYMLIANGDTMGGIYTSNIIAVAQK